MPRKMERQTGREEGRKDGGREGKGGEGRGREERGQEGIQELSNNGMVYLAQQ